MCVLFFVFCPCRYKVSTIPDNFISYKNIIACDIFCPPTLKFQVEKCSSKNIKEEMSISTVGLCFLLRLSLYFFSDPGIKSGVSFVFLADYCIPLFSLLHTNINL